MTDRQSPDEADDRPLSSPPAQAPVGKPRPLDAKPVVAIHVQPAPDHLEALRALAAADPCRVFGHWYAHLVSGGVACRICERPL